MQRTRPSFFLAQLTAVALVVKTEAQLLPAGKFKARDGRPGPGKFWELTDAQGVALAAQLTKTAQQSVFTFDYEHQFLNSLTNGQPAPSSGRTSEFEWRPGKGLYALNVKWTKRAQEMIDADEYIYISPLILHDDKGSVTGILNASLTNVPAVLGMDALIADLNARSSLPFPSHTQEPAMNLLQLLIAQLGIKADTTETEALSAVAALKARADAQPVIPQPLAAALAIKADAPVADAVAAIEGLKASTKSTTDTIAALTTQVGQLQANQNQKDLDAVIDQGVKDGKILPASKDWAVNMGKADLAALKACLDSMPKLPFGQTQSGGQDPGAGGGAAALSGMSAEIAARLDLTQEEFSGTAKAA